MKPEEFEMLVKESKSIKILFDTNDFRAGDSAYGFTIKLDNDVEIMVSSTTFSDVSLLEFSK